MCALGRPAIQRDGKDRLQKHQGRRNEPLIHRMLANCIFVRIYAAALPKSRRTVESPFGKPGQKPELAVQPAT